MAGPVFQPSLASWGLRFSSVVPKAARRSFSCATTWAGARATKPALASLPLGLGDFAFEPGDFLLQALALGRLVDFDFEHQPAVADDGDRRVGRGQGVDHAHVGEPGQELDVGRRALPARALSPLASRGMRCAGETFISPRRLRQAPTISFNTRYFCLGCGIDAPGLVLRVWREHDALAARPASGATFCHSSSVMKGMTGCARRSTASSTRTSVRRVARCSASLPACSLHLGQFQIPVAVFVPDEFVDRARGEVEAVAVEAFAHVLFRALQPAHDPAVDDRKRERQGRRPRRSPCLRCSSARSAWRSTACCRNCGSLRSGRGRN